MKKITGKGLSVKVNGSEVKFYMDNDLVARTSYFNNNEKQQGKIVVRFDNAWEKLKGFSGTTLTEEQYQEVINYQEETKKTIDNYFENLENAKLKLLSNGSIVFLKTEEQEELRDLNDSYFSDISYIWIRENTKNFTKERKTVNKGHGVMDIEVIYTFDKEKNEVAETKKQNKNNKRYDGLRELAQTMSDEDFEDVTGMKKDFILGI